MTKKSNLWAPWRLEYILSPKGGKCFLCSREKADKREKDNFMIVFRGKNVFVMLNAFPYNAGHLMIAPYKHVGDISLIDKEILYEISDLTVKAKDVLFEVMKPDGFNMGYNFGSAAGAGCKEHLHFHIVPRWNGDVNFMSVLGSIKVIPQALRDTAKILTKKFCQ